MRHPPDPIDVHVGARLRQARLAKGWAMPQLAERINVKYQQIQKYEIGANRISASTMWRLAFHLDVPPAYFFEGLEAGAGCNPPPRK